MVIRFLQFLFLGINFRMAYARINFWYWIVVLFNQLCMAAHKRVTLTDKELDVCWEIIQQIDD